MLKIWLLELDASFAFWLLAPVVYLVVIRDNLRVEAGLGCVDHDQLLGPRALLENVWLCGEHTLLLLLQFNFTKLLNSPLINLMGSFTVVRDVQN